MSHRQDWSKQRSLSNGIGFYVDALVSLGFHNKIPYTCLLKLQVYFLTLLETRRPRSSASMVRFWWTLPSWIVDGCLICVLTEQGERGSKSENVREGASSLVSLIRKPLFPHDGSTLMTSPKSNYYLSKVPPPNTITLGVSASVYGCWGDIIQLMEVGELGSKAGTVVMRVDWERW